MGQYLIPGETSILKASDFIGGNRQGCTWTLTPEGVLFEDPAISDAEAEALYSGFTPSGITDFEYVAPLPDLVRTHLQHMRDYRGADPATITNAQTVHVVKDLIRAVFYLNKRYETEG